MTLPSFPISSTKLFTFCTNSFRSPELHVYRNIPPWVRISEGKIGVTGELLRFTFRLMSSAQVPASQLLPDDKNDTGL